MCMLRTYCEYQLNVIILGKVQVALYTICFEDVDPKMAQNYGKYRYVTSHIQSCTFAVALVFSR